MFSSLFHPENSFFRFTGRVLDVVILSALWLVCSLPVVTLGSASAALYYSCVKCLRFREPHPYRNFWDAFRINLRTGIPATLVFLALGLLLDAGYLFLLMAAQSGEPVWNLLRIVYCVLLLLPIAVVSCAFPLLSRFTFTAGSLLSAALRLTLRHLPVLLGAAVINAALVFVTLKGWYFGVMLLTPALGALLDSLLLEPVLRRYTPGGQSPSGGEDGDGGRPWYLR